MDNFKSVLDFIRQFFSSDLERPRKRRGSELDSVISPKFSRFAPYKTRIIPITRETDETNNWFARTDLSHKKSPFKKNFPRIPMKPLIVDTVTLDDDDDETIEIKRPNDFKLKCRSKLKSFTSTPADPKNRSYLNGNTLGNDDDITFVKEMKSPSEKREAAQLAGFNYIKPFSMKTEKKLFSMGTSDVKNGIKPKSKSKTLFSRPSLANSSKGQSVLDYSYRLDDKYQYKKLLEQAAHNDSQNSSIYRTPVGKIFSSYDTANLSVKKSKSPYYSPAKTPEKPKETTKDRLIKVLDSLENEPVVVKDSDSDEDVIIMRPPSPKPDIKVDPVNSFKKIVDTSKVAKPDWVTDVVEKHKRTVENRQREIDELRECSRKQGEINRDINIELLRRKVNDCLQLKDVILPVIEREPEAELPPLTDEQLYMVQRAFRGDPNEVLARKFNLNITRRDLKTLSGLNWLNDEVINFYMNLIIERGKDPNWPKSYAFNTFFYTKLLKDGPQSLRRWTKRVDVFEHDIVCVPIHLGMHWCMAIIDFRDRSIRYYDSMGSPNNRCLEALQNYLEAEYKDKKGTDYDTSDFILENMDDIPQQMNGSDCGMFACTFAEFITRNSKITFKQEDMPYLRKKMVVEIMTGDFLIK